VAKTSSKSRMLHALKFTLGFMIVMGVLMLIGTFALSSAGNNCTPSIDNATSFKDWTNCRADFAEHALTQDGGNNAIGFTIGCLSVVGILYFALYTSFGSVFLPLDLMRSGKTVEQDEVSVPTKKEEKKEAAKAAKVSSLRDKYANRKNKAMSETDEDALADAEYDDAALLKAQNEIALNDKSCVGKVARVCRPFSMLIGILLLLFSLFIAICITLTSSDTISQIAHQHLNYKSGYSQVVPRMINPIDAMLSVLQTAFPIDLIILTAIIYYLVFCTAGGVSRLGIRFCFLKAFKVKSGKTVPQGLLCMVTIMMFTILALNIVLLTLAPKYMTYGSQLYTVVDPAHGEFTVWPSPETQLCDSDAPQFVFMAYNATSRFQTLHDYSLSNGGCSVNTTLHSNATNTNTSLDLSDMGCGTVQACVKSRMSALLHAFFYNAWFFGAIYYWANWLFIVVFFLSLAAGVLKKRSASDDLKAKVKEHKTNFDEDDDLVAFNPSWIR